MPRTKKNTSRAKATAKGNAKSKKLKTVPTAPPSVKRYRPGTNIPQVYKSTPSVPMHQPPMMSPPNFMSPSNYGSIRPIETTTFSRTGSNPTPVPRRMSPPQAETPSIPSDTHFFSIAKPVAIRPHVRAPIAKTPTLPGAPLNSVVQQGNGFSTPSNVMDVPTQAEMALINRTMVAEGVAKMDIGSKASHQRHEPVHFDVNALETGRMSALSKMEAMQDWQELGINAPYPGRGYYEDMDL
jgi:hypothetical protein